jgi:hypothetical protein
MYKYFFIRSIAVSIAHAVNFLFTTIDGFVSKVNIVTNHLCGGRESSPGHTANTFAWVVKNLGVLLTRIGSNVGKKDFLVF